MGSFTRWLGNLLWGPTMPDNFSMKPINDDQSWHEALAEDRALIFKHSPICHLSATAYRELGTFISTNATIPIYKVDVLNNRDMSDRVENEFGIIHESPQLILLSSGTAKWNESHWRIKADAIELALAELG